MSRQRTLLAPLALLAAASIACGGGDKAEPPPVPADPAPAPAPAPAPGQPGAPAAPAAQPAAVALPPATPDAQGIVHLTGNDQMRFSTNRIEVKAGQKIKIELKNAGALPKDVMGHNLIVLKAGSDVNALAAKGITLKASDYIPPDAPEIIAHTRLLGPGESQVLEFDVPGPGTYPFLCSFPGHVGLMNGQLVVQ
jgi:azurin